MPTARRATCRLGRRSGRRLPWFFVAALLVAVLLPMPARAPPPVPMVVTGHAYDRAGTPLPIGTPIRALLDGVDYANDSRVRDSAGSFSLMVQGNWMLNQNTPETPTIKEGPNPGETLLFVAGSGPSITDVFQETVAWDPAANATLDLHLGSITTSPSPLRFQGMVTRPARGGNQYVLLCNPTASPASLFDYFVEVDRPGTYHGGNVSLIGPILPVAALKVNLSSPSFLDPNGDALKLVYRNPGGASASAGGQDLVVDRIEFNASAGGTLAWEPGNTILDDAPAPGVGEMLNRTSGCGAPFQPGFRLTREPGVPAVTNVSLQIVAPTGGQVLTGGQPFTIRWSMSDNVFPSSVLRVWVNVTYAGNSYPLVAGASGTTSVAWTTPDVSDPGALVHVDVMDPYGAKGGQATGFVIQRATPFAVLIAIAVALVIVGFVLVAWLYARRKARETESPPTTAPPAVPRAPAAPSLPATPAPPRMKYCPRCGTQVRGEDVSCFFCGHHFVPPP